MVFEGGKVRLRGFREDDRSLFHARDRDMAVLDVDGPHSVTWGEVEGNAYLDALKTKPNETYLFAVETRTLPEVVGRIVLWTRPLPHRHGTFGIYLFDDERGKGYGTDAIRVLQRFAFDTIGLHRLGLDVRADNPARDLYLRLGFTHETTLREQLFIDGAHTDVWEMGQLENEWRASREQAS